jgi:anti-sigma B factor antagonist
MQLKEYQVDGVSVIELSGDLRVTDNPRALKGMVTALVDRGERQIVLKVTRLGRMDSSCLGEFVSSYTTATRYGGLLKLAEVGDHLRRLLSITKLDSVFEIYETEAAAVSSFRTGSPAAAPPVVNPGPGVAR